MELKFRDDIHEYKVGDEVYDSITQILDAEGYVDKSFYTESGRDRGTIRHKITHLHDIGELIEDELAEEYIPYLTAYKKFLTDTGCRVLESEVPRYHKTLRYAGTPDKVVEMRKYMGVIEVKGENLEPWHQLQTAAQAELVKQDFNVSLVKRYSLRLRSDGTYRLEEHASRQDQMIWLSIMACVNWKKIHLGRK